MLLEVANVAGPPGPPRRRWFCDEYFDLYVWQEDNGAIARFELCYAKGHDEHALRWTRKLGYSHARVDDGEGHTGRFKMTPLVTGAPEFNLAPVMLRFRRASAGIDASVALFVEEKLRDCPL